MDSIRLLTTVLTQARKRIEKYAAWLDREIGGIEAEPDRRVAAKSARLKAKGKSALIAVAPSGSPSPTPWSSKKPSGDIRMSPFRADFQYGRDRHSPLRGAGRERFRRRAS